MFGGHFYHERIRKAVAMFGSLFNNITVVRKDGSGKTLNQQKVPLSYSPADKYLQRIREQASLTNDMVVAVKLPRMSFEMTSMAYDGTRMLPKTGNITVAGTDNTKRKKIYNTVPYNISFQLNIYARAQDDCLQVVEQILPYFSPQYTLTIRPIEELSTVTEDVPVVLTGVSFQDDYEGTLEERRTIIYTLDFEMKCNFHSDITEGSIVRKAVNNLYQQSAGLLGEDLATSRVTMFPDPTNVSPDSDYGFTSIIERYEELFARTYQLQLSGDPAEAQAVVGSTFGVESILLTDSGVGFSSIPDITISTPPPAEAALAYTVVDPSTRKITDIVMIDSGTNYLTTPTVAIIGPTTPGFGRATATLSGDRLGLITLTNPGSNYDGRDSAPSVTIAAPDSGDSGATAIAILNGQYISDIVITDSGRGYFNPPQISIQAPPTPITARGRAIVANQRVSYIEIIDSGSNYTFTPTISIATPPGATRATAVASLNINNQISSITVTDPGSNYRTQPTVAISNTIALENEQYTVGESVVIELSNGIIVTADVQDWNDSNNLLTIERLVSSDNQSHVLEIGAQVTGSTSNARLILSNVIQGDKGF